MRSSRRLLIALALLLGLAGAALAQIRSSPLSNGAEGIVFIGMFHSPSDVVVDRTLCQRMRDFFDHSGEAHDVAGERPAVCDKVFKIVTGGDDPLLRSRKPIRAAKIATDSRHRIVVTEPGTRSVHILDFTNRKYTLIDGRENDRLLFPYAVAVDASDNIYVTDLKRGTIAVFSAEGKFKKYIGDFKGEHQFEQPDSIVIDRSSGNIFVADTTRQFVVILDPDGHNVASIGKRGGGSGPAEFRLPTDLALHDRELFVFDKKNRRIQVFDLQGSYKREFKTEVLGAEAPTGMAVDAGGRIYVPLDIGLIYVLAPTGEVLFHFGHYGSGAGEFHEARGVYIDSADRLYISDTGNERVQVLKITR